MGLQRQKSPWLLLSVIFVLFVITVYKIENSSPQEHQWKGTKYPRRNLVPRNPPLTAQAPTSNVQGSQRIFSAAETILNPQKPIQSENAEPIIKPISQKAKEEIPIPIQKPLAAPPDIPAAPVAAPPDPRGIKNIHIGELPPSSVWCFGQNRYERLCRFKNLCYLPAHDAFFITKANTTTLNNIPVKKQDALIDLTSLQDHSAFYFDYTEVSQSAPEFRNHKVRYVEKPTFLMSRFHAGNIMHTLHDDVIGLYFVLKEFAYQGAAEDMYEPFSKDHYVQFLDQHGAGEYANIFGFLTDNPILYRPDLVKDQNTITCYRDAVVGNSKQANWYHYGFGSPQGPIPNKTVDGTQVREVSNYLLHKAGLLSSPFGGRVTSPPENVMTKKVKTMFAEAGVTSDDQEVIVIFSRRRNRKLSNEKELAAELKEEFQLAVVYVRMEELTFLEQLAILQRTRVAIGMHGSILIMGMFLPENAILIELYPYAVPSENYTPYRKMASLPGMNLIYRAWENKHHDKTIEYPDRISYFGGIKHLPEKERKQILSSRTVPTHVCCTNPYWLFRIFQDTIATTTEILDLVQDAMFERDERIKDIPDVSSLDVLPSQIEHKSIKCTFSAPNNLTVTWATPWNGGRVDEYSIWEHNTYREYVSKTNKVSFLAPMDKVAQIWIKPVRGNWRGQFSLKKRCAPPGVTDDEE